MSDCKYRSCGLVFPSISIGIGIGWYVWAIKGFWWGVLYGLFWEIWVGYRLARYLLT